MAAGEVGWAGAGASVWFPLSPERSDMAFSRQVVGADGRGRARAPECVQSVQYAIFVKKTIQNVYSILDKEGRRKSTGFKEA